MTKARIPTDEFQKLKSMEQDSRSKIDSYKALKSTLDVPNKADSSRGAAFRAAHVLKRVFFEEGYNILDVVVAERGYGPISDSDTHYRGRVMEQALNGKSTSSSDSDFAYGELKLIETKEKHVLSQVMTVGCIFNKIRGEDSYLVVDKYEESLFYNKVKLAIIMPYRKVGMQLGVIPDNVFVFEVDNSLWFNELKEDWESIRDEMKQAIDGVKQGKQIRRASGICKSDTNGNRRPHGYLGIRSDGVIFTKKFFKIVSEHYTPQLSKIIE